MTEATLCSVEACAKPAKWRGWCLFHYGRWCKGIPFDRPVRKSRMLPMVNPVCSIEGCTGKTFARGWCRFHYERWRHTGDAIATCARCGVHLGAHRWKWCSNECKNLSPERRAQQSASNKRYALRNPEVMAERRAKNFERDRAAQRAWCKAHPERVRELSNQGIHRRRARMMGRISEPVTIVYLYERDNGRCGLCGGKVSLKRRWPDLLSPSKDHILPIAKGGDDSRANKQLAHLGCNLKKSAAGGGEQLRLLG